MVTRALTKTLHLHAHFEHTHSVQNLKRFLTASAVSVERRSLESLVNFKVSQVSRWDPIRGPDEFFEARRLIGFWLPCGQNGAFLASEQRQVSRIFKKKNERKKWRNEVWFCSYAPCPWLPSNPCAPNPWHQRGNVETWKPCCCAYFRLCLGSFRLARHSPPKRMRNIEKIQRCCKLLQAWNTFTN